MLTLTNAAAVVVVVAAALFPAFLLPPSSSELAFWTAIMFFRNDLTGGHPTTCALKKDNKKIQLLKM